MKKILGPVLVLMFTLLSLKTFAQQPDFYVSPNSQCFNAANTASAAISITVSGAATYSWTISNGTCSATYTNAATNGSVINISYPCCGVFTITCLPYTIGGVPINGALPTHTTNIQCSNFTANFSPMQTAQMGINFSNGTNNQSNGPLTYRWYFGDGTTSNTYSPSHTYSAVGIYTVMLVDSSVVSPFCSSTFTQAVQVCYANFTVPTPIYQGTTVTFTGTAAPSGTTTPMYWYLPGSSNSSPAGNNMTLVPTSYTSLGTQTVTFGFSSAVPFCSVAATQTINVLNPCTSITYTQSGGSVTLTAPANSTVSGSTFTWTGAFTGNGSTTSTTFTNNGTYNVFFLMSNTLCGNNVSSSLAVVVNSATCSLVPSYTFSQGGGGVVSFTSTSTGTNSGTTYTWNFGDNTSAVGSPALQHTYPANGTYFATLIVNNNTTPTCTQVVTNTIVVSSYTVPCNLFVGFTQTMGSNGLVNFINTSSGMLPGTTYTWSFGAGQGTSAAVSPPHTYSVNSVYTVNLTINNNSAPACNTFVSHTITVSSFPCSLTAGFTSTQGANGFVNFVNTTTGTTGATSYTWTYGDNTTPSITASGAHVYTANGIYTVTLIANNNAVPTCTNVYTFNVAVNSVPPCTLTAGFSSSNGAGGLVQFMNTSTGTSTTTTYNWNFGDGGTSTLTSPVHSYTLSGPFVATLTATDGSCVDTHTALTQPCMQSVNFNHTVTANGVVNFASTSTGTNSNSLYIWYFGDGQTASGGPTSSHTYTANGTYFDSLVVVNNTVQVCPFNTKNDTVVINTIPAPCTLTAAFSHTMGSGGLVNFTNQSVGTSTGMACVWDFGDGSFSTSQNPSHTYNNGGTHYVRLKVTGPGCVDSTVAALNVTGFTCTANSNFTLAPSGTPKFWFAIPSYPWNVTKALWTWGDGSSDTILYTSHIYSVAANYNICLTVTVLCGASASTCSSYSVYKGTGQTMDIISVNVMPPDLVLTALNSAENNEAQYSIFPNPNNGSFDLNVNGLEGPSAHINVCNLVGQVIYQNDKGLLNGELRDTIKLEGIPNGVFFVSIRSENKSITKKIVVNK